MSAELMEFVSRTALPAELCRQKAPQPGEALVPVRRGQTRQARGREVAQRSWYPRHLPPDASTPEIAIVPTKSSSPPIARQTHRDVVARQGGDEESRNLR